MPRTLFFVGRARFPAASAAKNMFESLALTVEVDNQYYVVVRADCTVATEHTKQFLASVLVGHSLLSGPDQVLEELHSRYHASAQGAIMAAVKDLHNEFGAWKVQNAHVK